MKWYSVDDIAAGYDIKPHRLKHWIRSEKLFAMQTRAHRLNLWGMYLIPECELYKLEKFRKGEPRFREDIQPCEFLTLRRNKDEEDAIAALLDLNDTPDNTHTGVNFCNGITYSEYMRSGHWREVRQAVFERDGWQCRRCGTGKNLRAHHLTYRHLGGPEELDDVITLCDDCHYHVHKYDLDDIDA